MTTQTMPLDNLMHCAACGDRMSTGPSDDSYRCAGCGTRIDALNANRMLIKHIVGYVVTADLAAKLRGPVQEMFEEHVRQEMPGVEPPDTSAEEIQRYALHPDTYLRGDPEDATELMGIIVERIDADGGKAVITYRLAGLNAAAGSMQTINLQPVP